MSGQISVKLVALQVETRPVCGDDTCTDTSIDGVTPAPYLARSLVEAEVEGGDREGRGRWGGD